LEGKSANRCSLASSPSSSSSWRTGTIEAFMTGSQSLLDPHVGFIFVSVGTSLLTSNYNSCLQVSSRGRLRRQVHLEISRVCKQKSFFDFPIEWSSSRRFVLILISYVNELLYELLRTKTFTPGEGTERLRDIRSNHRTVGSETRDGCDRRATKPYSLLVCANFTPIRDRSAHELLSDDKKAPNALLRVKPRIVSKFEKTEVLTE